MSLPHELKQQDSDARRKEPTIATPEEDAERATHRLKDQERSGHPIYPLPNDPERQGGESSPSPEKRERR